MKMTCVSEGNDRMLSISSGDASTEKWLQQQIRAHVRENLLKQRLSNLEINYRRIPRAAFSRK